jgi:DNA-binding response OmpR family regulator
MTTQQQTILVVDDDIKLLDIMRDKFKQAGYRVLLAKNGEEGLAMALKERPTLILLDLRMPQMDGQALLESLRKDPWGEKVPVMVLTNSDSGHTVYLNIKDSVQGYFVKAEVSLKDVLTAVKDHIDSLSKN